MLLSLHGKREEVYSCAPFIAWQEGGDMYIAVLLSLHGKREEVYSCAPFFAWQEGGDI